MSSEIVVIGSCNVDLISYMKNFPKAGETLCGEKFSIGCGGKGANQCVMAGKLGAATSMISCVGDDTFGKMFLNTFKDVNVDTSHVCVIKDGVSTGVAQILVNGVGENCIAIVKGANDHLKKEHIDDAKQIISAAKVVLFQLEIDVTVTLYGLKVAKENGCKTIFNPAPAIEGLSDNFLKNTSILVCNETEAQLLTGRCVTSQSSCEEAIKELLNKGPEYVVLTLGARGAMFSGKSEDDIQHVIPDQLFLPEAVVDTTGAGDCFVGALSYFIARREDLPFKEKVQRAVNIASISVGKPGTQTSYPTFEELPNALKT